MRGDPDVVLDGIAVSVKPRPMAALKFWNHVRAGRCRAELKEVLKLWRGISMSTQAAESGHTHTSGVWESNTVGLFNCGCLHGGRCVMASATALRSTALPFVSITQPRLQQCEAVT